MSDIKYEIGKKYVTHDGHIITYSLYTNKNLILCEYKGAGPDKLFLVNNDNSHPDYMKVSSTPNPDFKNAAIRPIAEESSETVNENLTIGEMASDINPIKGTKHDSQKPMFACLPPDAMLELGKVAELGARKYGHHNFRKGIEGHRYIDAAFRHLLKFISGENVDPNDGNNHLASAAWNCLAVLQAIKDDPSLDTRYKK